ncbi:hypothetical protein QJS10_CPA16g00878 [Acorus calamus]|uniref:Uncharacterized protein n=1 Tax=Acorus calamus TaxID=4465 RepID=A0AAV9D006_ACOCL|nr:hypothetical protein QJS10_CPA16g00878 [Acorus calamus]
MYLILKSINPTSHPSPPAQQTKRCLPHHLSQNKNTRSPRVFSLSRAFRRPRRTSSTAQSNSGGSGDPSGNPSGDITTIFHQPFERTMDALIG